MPQFNPWIHQPLHSSTLEHYGHNQAVKQRAREAGIRFAGELGYAAGSAVSFPVSYGMRRFSQWYYPSEKIRLTKKRYGPIKTKKKKRKVCCRYWKGKKYCSPEFCEKRRKLKYYY